METKEKFLPIGSVVLLQEGTKKVMITGFCSIAVEDKTKVYDYSGCIYPEGYLNSNEICLFDHNQISKIFFLGYENEEEKEFKDGLKKLLKEYENGELESPTEAFFNEEDGDLSEDEEDNDESETENQSNNLEYL